MMERNGDPSDDGNANRVTSAELVRSFAKWREAAHSAPVQITTHGRVSHILSGIKLHEQMARPDTNENASTADEYLSNFSEWLDECMLLCDTDEKILYANARVRQSLGITTKHVGMTLGQAMPEVEDSVVQLQYRRTLRSGEALVADLPSVFDPERWMSLRTIRLGNRLILMMRDITDEVHQFRMADAKAALYAAISNHPLVGYVRVDARGLIAKTDASFDGWIGLSSEKIEGIRLSDLVSRDMRPAFRNVLDAVLQQNERQYVEVELIPNHEEKLQVKCSVQPLRGAYGSEGAAVVMTRAPASVSQS